jgi:hypothetical protein
MGDHSAGQRTDGRLADYPDIFPGADIRCLDWWLKTRSEANIIGQGLPQEKEVVHRLYSGPDGGEGEREKEDKKNVNSSTRLVIHFQRSPPLLSGVQGWRKKKRKIASKVLCSAILVWFS